MVRLSKFASDDGETSQVDQVVNLLKEHPIVQGLFDRYEIPIHVIDRVPIDFKKMDVSAKTKDGKISINERLVENGDLVEDLHYIVHELVHVLQQMVGKVKEYSELGCVEYLDNPLEIEAFKEQIKFIENYKSLEEADKYLDKLLDFHELEGTERKKKRKQLRGE